MKIRLSRRRTFIAAAATTLALGSAAAYAITLPIHLPGLNLDVPVDLPSPLIAPPNTQLPANPIVGAPDGNEADELASDLRGIADPDGAHAKDGPTPARKPAAAPQKAAAPGNAKDKAGDAAKELKDDLTSLKDDDHESLGDLKDLLADDDWSKLMDGHHDDGSISVTLGQGINVCNNNNVKIVVNRDSHDDSTDIDQHNSSNDVVTEVSGQHTEPSAPNISCDH